MQPGGSYVNQLVFMETVANLAAVCVDLLGVATFLAEAIIPGKCVLKTMDSSYRHKFHQALKFGVYFTICDLCNFQITLMQRSH